MRNHVWQTPLDVSRTSLPLSPLSLLCEVQYKLRPRHIGVWTEHHTSHIDGFQVSPCDICGRPVPRKLLFTQYFGFALSVSPHQCPILTLTYPPLLSGQPRETWKPSKKQWSFGNWEHWIEKCYYFCVRTTKNMFPVSCKMKRHKWLNTEKENDQSQTFGDDGYFWANIWQTLRRSSQNLF